MTAAARPPRLLVLTSTYPRWTNDHEPPFVHELARRLTDRFDVTVLAPHAPGALHREWMEGVLVQRFRYAPDRFERLAYDGGIPTRLRRQPLLVILLPFFLLAQAVATLRIVRQSRPDAIHAHWLLPQGLVALVARPFARRGARLVVTAHGADVFGLRSPIANWAKRLVLTHADAVTLASRALAAEMHRPGVPSAPLHVLPMGVDLRQRFDDCHKSARNNTLMFCGRLVAKKGVGTLVRALPKVLRQYPNWRLLIAGDGPEREPLQRLAHKLGVCSRVEFKGRYRNDELPQMFAQADIAVFPFEPAAGGDQEGLGLVTVEAMGCGLPVIAGDVPAVRDVVVDGKTGLLVPPRDSTALAQAIIRLIRDPVYAAMLAAHGRSYVVERFDWSLIAARYIAVLTGTEVDEPQSPD
jgi:phosphatidylinositol alpha-1,6-mannosyltransferase